MAVAIASRRNFGRETTVLPLPNLIEVQLKSYEWFLTEGIRELLDEINPIEDFTAKALALEFREFAFDEPKLSPDEARDKNMTYKAQLKVRAVLTNRVTGEIKENDVYLGEFPLMTKNGTFIINGVERAVVSQIVRSYGVLFTSEQGADRQLFGAKLIPSRGAWLEFETSSRDVLSVKVDRKRRIPVTTLLRALGYSSSEEIKALFTDVDTNPDHQYIDATLDKDPAENQDEGYVEVYKRIRPGDLATKDNARAFLEALFYSAKRYDLGAVGRYKMNKRLGLDTKNAKEDRVLRPQDIVEIVKEIIRLNNTKGAKADDMDSLYNRRVRSVGELVQNRVRVGMVRLERNVRDRMSVAEIETVTPSQLVNSRPIVAALQEFFASSQLSQFMNQTNPIAELEHKRCLTATGQGGLSRERAGFEVRDVHTSHYGRMCPIETPEGPNIGLVQYLASYANVNDFGFIETPYRKVVEKNGKRVVSSEIVYLDAAEEEKYVIAPASVIINEDGTFGEKRATVRKYGTPSIDATEKIDFVDVSPKQAFSITTNLIPGLEQDDAARSSMGSNMQRQAVPTLRPDSPVVGTGVEGDAARQSGHVTLAEVDGEVTAVSADEIVVTDSKGVQHGYRLQKFVRSNQGTLMSQRPNVDLGQKVKKGDPIADSSATDNGELALGQNVLVAYMSWGGYNFEDAVIISERLLRNDNYTSIHIEKYTMDVRDTKLGPEQITRDIPNVGEEALRNLDEEGIILIGAEVESGDILVGKISPKGETELTAEERLLRAVFGEKAKDVRDSSLRLPHGERGKVIGIKIFTKDNGDELSTGVFQSVEVTIAQMRKISVGDKLAGRHGNKGVISIIVAEEDMPYLEDGTPIDMVLNPLGVIGRMNLGQIMETTLGWAAAKNGEKVAVPVFTSITDEQLRAELKKADLPEDGKVKLIDGRTGEAYEQTVTVGINYMLKLSHLVDDKMHARSVGPYSMITQQPLGGKAQMGGQRFGEMEVWALEAYGAAHTLQEMLTVKSDDTVGRAKAYESIIRGEEIQKPSIPESFNVLVRELQGLGLEVNLITEDGEMIEPVEKPKVPVKPTPAHAIPDSDDDMDEEEEDGDDFEEEVVPAEEQLDEELTEIGASLEEEVPTETEEEAE
ncbi:MAG TPA: DNA-directed RNA polymerase subunit beta [Verrucomicrobiae bacterium]|nr:DNA-directed RNA polymerase subunit beta [Verrucomicrobiae bacterium]